MRFLNKFYGFLKSVYLNNSKYSNNLRHTLRIFFEREVKTKYTPTMFGSTFKGSKWVDYQTFNINKLLIKSGLSYFYYIFTLFSLVLLFLGRSKAEQYFGFLPFFVYINFLLGYIPLVLSDITSQLILTIYFIYNFVYKLLYQLLNKVTNKTVTVIENSYSPQFNSKKSNTLATWPSLLFSNMSYSDKISNKPLFSKTLSILRKNLLYINHKMPNGLTNLETYPSKGQINTSTLKLKNQIHTYGMLIDNTLTLKESIYLDSLSATNFKVHNINSSLNDITRLYKMYKYPAVFNFNISANLEMAKQQRWVSRNSLLNESFITNSFLITQSKKLIGLGTLDNEFSSKNIWLPTKFLNTSSNESNTYLNSVSKYLYSYTKSLNTLQTNDLTSNNFQHLNFFENSRLWLFKKYFFTNNQTQNMIISFPKTELNLPSNKNTRNSLYTTSYNLNVYNINLKKLIFCDITPSLYSGTTIPATNDTKLNLTHTINLNTSQLDVLSGGNINFVYNLTSNRRHMGNTEYYSPVTKNVSTISYGLLLPLSVNKIKFTI